MIDLVIVPTGTANIASVIAAFSRLGVQPRLAETAADIERASHVMLPGVGSFGAAMSRLRARGFDRPLTERIRSDRPTICICVGHQLLFEASSESPGIRGLGVVPGEIERFDADVRVPQFGWNEVQAEVEAAAGEGMLRQGHAYFANSYRATAAVGWRVLLAEHGGPFIAAMERGRVVGCQFHPELSGTYGAALLGRFMALSPC